MQNHLAGTPPVDGEKREGIPSLFAGTSYAWQSADIYGPLLRKTRVRPRFTVSLRFESSVVYNSFLSQFVIKFFYSVDKLYSFDRTIVFYPFDAIYSVITILFYFNWKMIK